MGMDLKPQCPTLDAPIDVYDGTVRWGRYNWSGWIYITELFKREGVPMEEFSGSNDGDMISATTCELAAQAIERALPTLSQEDQIWLQPHIALWRTCGGYKQY